MFCKSCGTELPDGSLFCTNCGAKIEAEAAPVVEPTPAPAPAVEPTPAPAPDYGYNPNPAPDYGYNPNPAPAYEQGAYGYYDNTAAMGAAPAPKKGKGLSIAALIFGILAIVCCPLAGLMSLIGLILAIVALAKKSDKKGLAITGLILSILGGIIGIILAIVVFIPAITAIVATGATVNEILENPDYYLNGDYEYDYDYGNWDYDYDYDYDFDYDYDYDNNNGGSSSNGGSVDTSVTSSSVEGSYYGTSEWVAVSGADELIDYLEELYGRSLSESEKAGIRGDNDLNSSNSCALDIYYDDSYAYADGDWQIYIDMGDYFGGQYWDSWDVLTYDEFRAGEYTKGFINPSNGYFALDVTEEDPSGEYAAQVFETYEEGNGIYGIKFSGTVYDNGDGTHSIDGTFEIMFMYGDMTEPYVQTHSYSISE